MHVAVPRRSRSVTRIGLGAAAAQLPVSIQEALSLRRAMDPTAVKDFFQRLPGLLDSGAAEDLDAVYQFDLSGAQGGQYVLTIRDGVCQVTEGVHADPHVVLSMAGEDCIKVLTGQLSGKAVAMSGRLKVSGDLGLAMQLKALFPSVR
ncbi:MAG TPA: SCP2 sterol-binding domain-containing protein [Nitrospiraceae bacterium]